MNGFKTISMLILLFVICLHLPGCGSPTMNMSLAGLPNQNPDISGRPSPVILKMYELRNDSAFKQAEMGPLFEDPLGTLGADMVAFDEITMVPGEAKVLVYEPAEETRFVGVMASFRQLGHGPWKIIKAINPEKKSKIALELNSASLILIDEDKTKKWDPVEALDNYKEESKPVMTPVSRTNVPLASSVEEVDIVEAAGASVESETGTVSSTTAKPATPKPMNKKY